jgi:signal-transduction protein with cAMP-binding, CBS, and nucleotidyltransferase domain
VEVIAMVATFVGPHSAVVSLLVAEPVGVRRDATLQSAARMMREHNVSSLVVDGGEAILTERDLTDATAAGHPPSKTVATAMTPDPVSVISSVSVLDAAGVMLEEEVRHLIVKDPGGPVLGVVSLRAVIGVLAATMEPASWVAVQRAITKRSEIWLG